MDVNKPGWDFGKSITEGGLQGAGAGAAAGGATFGPLGALIGGIGGGLTGMFSDVFGGGGGQQQQQQASQEKLAALMAMIQRIQQDSGARRIAGQLASGTGASQAMLTQGLAQATGNIYGNAASMRGVSALQAAHIANRGAADLFAKGSQNAALLRLQELMGASQLFQEQDQMALMPILEQIRGEYGLQGQAISASAAADAETKRMMAELGGKTLETGGKVLSTPGVL